VIFLIFIFCSFQFYLFKRFCANCRPPSKSRQLPVAREAASAAWEAASDAALFFFDGFLIYRSAAAMAFPSLSSLGYFFSKFGSICLPFRSYPTSSFMFKPFFLSSGVILHRFKSPLNPEQLPHNPVQSPLNSEQSPLNSEQLPHNPEQSPRNFEPEQLPHNPEQSPHISGLGPGVFPFL